MPDEDKFERLLRGKGWRRAYRLAAGNAPLAQIVDSLISAAAEAMRTRVFCPSLQRIKHAVREALSSHASRFEASGNWDEGNEGFEQLTAILDEIEANDFAYVGTQIAVKAAEEAFLELTSDAESGALDDVQDRLGEIYVEKLIDYQWLSRIRAGVAEENGRNAEEQSAWERELREQLKMQARKLFDNAVKAQHSEMIRAPRRLNLRSTPIEDQLQNPLVPLEKS